jgi:hypothetical protein
MPPRGRAGQRPAVEASHEQRQVRAAELEAAHRTWPIRRERLRGTHQAAVTETARLRRELEAALARQNEADRAMLEAQAEHDALVIGAERFLRATASPLIDEVVYWLRDQQEGLRRHGVLQITERWGPRNPLTDVRPRQTYSNAAEIDRRRLAIAAALKTWDGYRLQAVDPAELQARAEALPASLPVVDGSIEAPMEPILTPAELREIAWRQEARS